MKGGASQAETAEPTGAMLTDRGCKRGFGLHDAGRSHASVVACPSRAGSEHLLRSRDSTQLTFRPCTSESKTDCSKPTTPCNATHCDTVELRTLVSTRCGGGALAEN
eukprot:918650-Rhodomonas_salina.1